MAFEIKIELAQVSAKPPLRALADVTLCFSEGEVTVRRCPVFAKPGDLPWATLPRLSFTKKGKKTYVQLLDLPSDLKQRVLTAVLDEYRRRSNTR